MITLMLSLYSHTTNSQTNQKSKNQVVIKNNNKFITDFNDDNESVLKDDIHNNALNEENSLDSNLKKHETDKFNYRYSNRHYSDSLKVSFGGYMEYFYSYNFNKPANNITALRGFDFIHNSMTIGNFVMATDASYKNFSTRLAINVGANPSQFYEQEPSTIPSYNVPVMDRFSWQFIQEALVSWDLEKIPGLTMQAGIMATPIGIEGLPNHQTWKESVASPHMLPKDYRENWNWSRSNSFINVPDYHSGIRILYSVSEKSHFGFFLLNGQNMVTDNNDGKKKSKY